jgi:hypothetical protein
MLGIPFPLISGFYQIGFPLLNNFPFMASISFDIPRTASDKLMYKS